MDTAIQAVRSKTGRSLDETSCGNDDFLQDVARAREVFGGLENEGRSLTSEEVIPSCSLRDNPRPPVDLDTHDLCCAVLLQATGVCTRRGVVLCCVLQVDVDMCRLCEKEQTPACNLQPALLRLYSSSCSTKPMSACWTCSYQLLVGRPTPPLHFFIPSLSS